MTDKKKWIEEEKKMLKLAQGFMRGKRGMLSDKECDMIDRHGVQWSQDWISEAELCIKIAETKDTYAKCDAEMLNRHGFECKADPDAVSYDDEHYVNIRWK